MHALPKASGFSMFLVSWLFFSSIQSVAQNFSLGLKAGPSITRAFFADKDAASDFKSKVKVGFSAAGVIQFPLKKQFAFVTEAGYAVKGRTISFNEDTWKNKATYQFVDLSMALRKSFNLQIKKNVPTRCFFNVGPNIEYWLNGKGKIITQALSTNYSVVFNKIPDGNIRNNYLTEVNRWFFGMDLGIGADANITKTQRVLVELRFTYGHTNMGKKNGNSTIDILGFEDNIKANFKTLTLSGCYFLDLDRRKSKFGKSTKDREIKRKRN